MKDKILESIKYVVDNSVHVKINNEKVNYFADSFQIESTVHWIQHGPFNIFTLSIEEQVNLILIMSGISFSYWGLPKWTIEYRGQSFDGAYGMLAALGKAIENGYPILNSSYLSQISENDFGEILKGNVEIPLFYERLNIIREIGSIIDKNFDKDFFHVTQQVNSNANLLNIIIDNFSCFTDKSNYKNREIFFYKKAQLLTSDILQIIPKSEYGAKLFSSLTACADYKLPQVLREYELIEYSTFLSNTIDKKVEIKKGSEEEIEIRANTIWVIELIKEKMKQRVKNIDSMTINDQIWLLSQNNGSMRPYHLTRTTAY